MIEKYRTKIISQISIVGLFVIGFGLFIVPLSPISSQAAYAFCIGSAIVSAIVNRKFEIPRFLVISSLLLSSLCLLALFHTPYWETSLEWTSNFLRLQLVAISAVILYVHHKNILPFVNGICTSGVIVAVFQLRNATTSAIDVGRAGAGAVNVNEYAAMALIVATFVLFYPTEISTQFRVMKVAIVLLLLVSALSTASRGSLPLVCILLFSHFYYSLMDIDKFKLQSRSIKLKEYVDVLTFPAIVIIFVMLFFTMGGSFSGTINRLSTVSVSASKGFNGRTEVQETALPIILQSPIVGYGVGISDKLIENGGNHGFAQSLHNTYLEMLLAFGVVGFICYMFLLSYCLKLVQFSHIPEKRLLFISVLLISVATLAMGWQSRALLWTILYISVASLSMTIVQNRKQSSVVFNIQNQ